MPTNNGFDQSYQAPVYSSGLQAVKKKFNPLAIIIPAAVLVVAAVVILIIVFSQKSDYKKAEQNFFNNTFGSALSSANDAAGKLKNEAESIKIKFDAPSGSLDIPSFSAKIDTAPKGDNTYTEISFSMNDMDLDIQGWIDSAAESVLIYFPKLSDIYAKIDIGKMVSTANQQLSDSNIDYEKLNDALDRVFSKVSDTYFELIGDPEIETNQEFKLEGKTYKADKCVISLDAEQIGKLVKVLFEAIVDDNELMELIAEMSGGQFTASDIKYELKNLLDNSFDSAFSEISGYNFSIDMTVYMKKNTIIGREIKVKVSGLSAVTLSFYDIPTNDGRVIAFKTGSDILSLMNTSGSSSGYSYDSNANVMSLLLDVTFLLEDNAKGDVHSGTATFKAGDHSIVLNYEDMALTDKLCQGKATLRISDMPSFNATLELSKDGDNKVIELNIPNICNVAITEGPSDLEYKEIPNVPSNSLVIIDSTDTYNLQNNEAFQQLIQDISSVFGYGYGQYYID